MLSAIFLYWPRRRVHVSFCIAFLCGGAAFGIGLAKFVPAGIFMGSGWLALAVGLAGIGLWRQRYWTVPLLIVAGLLGGLWRGSLVNADLAQYQVLYGRTLFLTGTVREDPGDTSGTMVLKLGDVAVGPRHFGGVVWVSASTRTDIKRSDRVTVSGKVGPGFGTFAGSVYRARLVIDERVAGGDPALDVRDWFADRIRSAIPEPEASLGIGYLVGQKSALPTDLAAAFVTTGLTQAVVASGYNLTVLVRPARKLFVRSSRYLSAFAAAAMIIGFMAVTGLGPSMTRAGIVSGLSLLAWYYGRAVHPLVLLSLAAALTLLYNPSYAWGDLGWSLSFSAFGGVMVLGPLLNAYFFGEGKAGLVRGLIVETLAATITTLPILIFAFGQFSNVILFASLLVLPLIPLAMLFTFIAGIGAVIVPPLAGIFGLPATIVLWYSIHVAKFFAGLDWATSYVSIGPLAVVGAYVAIVLLCTYLWRATKTRIDTSSLL